MKTFQKATSQKANTYRFYDDPAGGGDSSPEEITVTVKRDAQGRPLYALPDGKPLFTQEHMNKEIGNARVTARKEGEGLVAELEKLRDMANTSEAVKARLNEQIDALKTQMATKEEALMRELEDWRKKYAEDTKKHQEAAEAYQRRWREQMIATDIITNAERQDAFSARQVFDLLARTADVKPRLDEQGNETGEYQTVITIRDIDPKTKTEKLVTLPADQAIKRMKEIPEQYGNLFRPADRSGTGLSPMNPFGPPSVKGLDLSSPEAYFASIKGQEHLVTSNNNGVSRT